MLDHFFPLLFPKDSQSLKNIWHPSSGRGGKKTVKRYLKSEQTDTRTDRRTDRQTFRLIESMGPEGRCFENHKQTRANPGDALQTPSLINWLIHWSFSYISLLCRHALMVEDGAFSRKIDKVHLSQFFGSKVTVILVNGGILPRGGVALGRVCPAACAAGLLL